MKFYIAQAINNVIFHRDGKGKMVRSCHSEVLYLEWQDITDSILICERSVMVERGL